MTIENLLISEGLLIDDIDDAMRADFLLVRGNGRIKGMVGLQRTGTTTALAQSLAVDSLSSARTDAAAARFDGFAGSGGSPGEEGLHREEGRQTSDRDSSC
jgi:hypothetical protein